MGIYARYIFPHLEVLATKGLVEERKSLLESIDGRVLEIGAGAGQNFPYFPQKVDQAIGLEPSPLLRKKALKSIEKMEGNTRISVINGFAEKLPWEDEEFDTVVSFLVLCSVKDTDKALQEINRVLKKGGRLFLFEHVLADDPNVAKWQERITPLWKVVGCGCHLNRDTATSLQETGFDLTNLEKYRSKNMGPSISSHVIKGYVTKA